MPSGSPPRSLGSVLLAAIAAAACSGDAPATVHVKAKAAAARPASPRDPEPAGPAVRLGDQAADGVPHSGLITRIELAPDGSAALTRDARGSVRVWAALDGSAQPQRIPVGAPRHMSLARRRGGRALTVAMVDSAGELRLFRTDERGHPAAIERAAAGGRPALAAQVLAGGDRVAILRDDLAIELADDTGAVLARLEQRGFRPVAFAASAAGNGLVALSVDAGSARHHISIRRIDVAASGMTMRPSSIELTAAAAFGPSQWSLNPSGNRVALLEAPPGPTWHLIAADLEADTVEDVELPVMVNERVAIGFVDDRNVIATQRPTPVSLRVDLGDKGAIFPAVTPDTRSGDVVQATAPGTRAAAMLTWLWVDAQGRGPVFMGYDPFQAAEGAISPDNRWVAWTGNPGGTGAGIHVRALRGQAQPRAAIPYPPLFGRPLRVLFLDERRLILADTGGEVRLIDWTTGTEIDAVDTGGAAAGVELDARRGLLAVFRPGGQVWVYRVSAERGFRAPLLVADGAERMGLLTGGGPALWTLDRDRKLRTYTLADLERGQSRTQALAGGTQLDFSPVGLDRQGRFLAMDPSLREVRRIDGPKDADVGQTFPRQPTGPVRPFPSPDGKRMAILRPEGVLAVYDGAGDQPSWDRAFLETVQSANWSDDSSLLAVGGRLGASVLDAATGKVVDMTCGPVFHVVRAPPAIQFDPPPLASLCEADVER
jgi:hypothetical protein